MNFSEKLIQKVLNVVPDYTFKYIQLLKVCKSSAKLKFNLLTIQKFLNHKRVLKL